MVHVVESGMCLISRTGGFKKRNEAQTSWRCCWPKVISKYCFKPHTTCSIHYYVVRLTALHMGGWMTNGRKPALLLLQAAIFSVSVGGGYLIGETVP